MGMEPFMLRSDCGGLGRIHGGWNASRPFSPLVDCDGNGEAHAGEHDQEMGIFCNRNTMSGCCSVTPSVATTTS